ncbi:MAG: hypothetical protein ACRD2W_11875, partial [Acidimicrobiales bacterium]
MTAPIYLDTGVFWSFAIVDGLGHFGAAIGRRVRWTEAVEAEVKRNTSRCLELWNVPSSPWLRRPIRLEGRLALEAIRLRDSLARSGDSPWMHLGEAESIVAALNHAELTSDQDHAVAMFASDDYSARRLGRRQGLEVVDTEDLIRMCVEAGRLSCDEALRLHRKMLQAGRSLDTNAGVDRLCGRSHVSGVTGSSPRNPTYSCWRVDEPKLV